jgi:crotonobetainyl-CoA:carnitine CoA-transferase CaiB-like acyl-CoA transferase
MAKHNDIPTTGLLSGVKVVAYTAVIAAPFAVAM